MDLQAQIARIRQIGGPQAAAAARALLAAINATPDMRAKASLADIQTLEMIASHPPAERFGKAEHAMDAYAEEALALASLHAELFNACLDAGQPVSSDAMEQAEAELADVGARIEYADGQWFAVADDEPGGVRMYGKWYVPGYAEGDDEEPLRFAASEWVHEPGPRSKNRYRNSRTGQVRYFKNPPKTREQRQDDFRQKGDVDKEKLKQRTQGHAQQDDAAVKKQAANAFRALYYHHGDFVVHRLQELADDTEAALGKAQEGTPAHDALKRKMAALDMMLAHADERGITGKVPPRMVAESAAPEPWAGKGDPDIGKVYNAPTDALHVDPKRFQFKLKTDESGVTQELKSVRTWNPDFAGVLAVWKDPEDGKTYVVNGHHRRELAGRLGVGDLAVRYIEAATPEEARAKGALINIAGGRGTPVDAAKFMREAGVGPEGLAEEGVSLSGKLAEDAVALTKLSDPLFDRVARDDIDLGKALAIGRNLPDHARQEKLVKILDKRDEEGKDVGLRTVEEMAKEMGSVPSITRNDAAEGMGLFGNEDYDDDVFVERNELKGFIRAQLAQDVNDFSAVASKRRANKVAGVGNVLDTEKNKQTAEEADRVRNTFDRLVNLKGPVSATLNEAAKVYATAKGKKAKDDAKRKALDALRTAVAAELAAAGPGEAQGQPGPQEPDQVAQGGDGSGQGGNAASPQGDDAGRGSPGEYGLNPSVPLAVQGKISHNTNGGTPQKEAENGREDSDRGRVSEREAVPADDSDARAVRTAGIERPVDDRRVQPGQVAREDGERRDADRGAAGPAGGTRREGSVGSGTEQADRRGDEGGATSPGSSQQVKAEPVFTAKQRVRENLGKGDADKNPNYRAALEKLHESLSANGLTTPDLVEPFKAARNQNERAAAVKVAAKKWGVDVQSADHVLQMAAKASSVKGTDKVDSRPGQSTKQPIEGDSLPKAADGSNVLSPPASPDPSTTAFFTPPPVQGNLLNDNGGEWVKPLTSGEKAKPLYTPNSDTPTRTQEEIDGKTPMQRSMEQKERASESSAPQEYVAEVSDMPEESPAATPQQSQAAIPVASNDDDFEYATPVDMSKPDAIAGSFANSPMDDGLSDRLDRIYDQVKQGVPSLTPQKWQQFLQKAWDDKAVELQGINEARQVMDTPGASDKVLKKGDRMLAYAIVKDPQKLKAMIQQMITNGGPKQQPSQFAKPEAFGWASHGDLVRMAAQQGVPIDARDDRNAILRKLAAS